MYVYIFIIISSMVLFTSPGLIRFIAQPSICVADTFSDVDFYVDIVIRTITQIFNIYSFYLKLII